METASLCPRMEMECEEKMQACTSVSLLQPPAETRHISRELLTNELHKHSPSWEAN